MRDFEQWLDKNHVRSTAVLFLALVMLFWVTDWSMKFAVSSSLDGLGRAAVIAAVQVPASFFAKWAFETYERIMK